MPRSDTRTFNEGAVAVAFPLGGVGTGNVSLGARGELRDWEIFNEPNKGTMLPNTFFALRTHIEGEHPVTKVLEGPIQPPHALSHGYHPSTGAGLPRMHGTTFRGEYPFATIDFDDDDLPVRVSLEAWTPLVPLDPEASGIPCAIFTYTLTNTSDHSVALTLVGSLANPIGGVKRDKFGNIGEGGDGGTINEARDANGVRGLLLRSERFQPHELGYGDMSLTTTHPTITTKRAWLRGGWYDYLREFWNDLVDDGTLTDLGYETPAPAGRTDTGSLGLLDTLAPGASATYQFILSWSFPVRPRSWRGDVTTLTRTNYALRFADSWAVAAHVVANFEHLETATRAFHAALYDSTLPGAVVDAAGANIVSVRSTTCFWLEDGNFYGYEGCFDDAGCCDGTCTHVWSYAHTAAFLFPSLERSMRRIEFVTETEPDGYMTFRNYKNFDEQFVWGWGDQKPEAAVDGQMGSILRVLREWQLSGDRAWLADIWPGIKRAIQFASVQWDNDGDGVLDGRQHNTYDIEFWGPNPLCSLYYLAALRAVEELALAMDEPDYAAMSRAAFRKASPATDQALWNGEYFVQRSPNIDEHPYQHGVGCLSDQLLGQLHARILGLGDLVPADHVRSALGAIFRHNFRRDFRNHVNCQRTYVLNGESGLLLCTWPDGDEPRFPFPYSDEVWTGIEYQVAAHLFYEGATAEGLAIVEAARARHDGTARNPWNEVECGHHYARAMSSWAMLLALSGAHADLPRNTLSFAPVLLAPDADAFSTFWSSGRAWGTYTQRRGADGAWHPELTVLGGDASSLQVRACGQTWTVG